MRMISKCLLLFIASISTPISFYCLDDDLKYNYASSVVEYDQREITKINKEYVLRYAYLGVEVYPGFNIILSCVLDLLVHWGRETVTLITDDMHFGSGSSKTNVVEWFKSKGIVMNLKTITTLQDKELIEVSSVLSDGRDFIIICQSNFTSELLSMESKFSENFKNYIIVDSSTSKLFEHLTPFWSQFILVSATYFGKIYKELLVSEIHLFHMAYINYTNSWELIKFADWTSNNRLNLLTDFDYCDADARLKNQTIRIATRNLSECGENYNKLDMKSLSIHLNFNMQCIAPEKPYFGIDLGNGTFDGVLGILQNRDADISSNTFYPQSNRFSVIRLVAPQTFTTMTIWYRQADATISHFAHALAFNWSTWATVLGTLLTLTVVLAFTFIKVNILRTGTFEQRSKWIFTGDMVIDILNEMPGPSNKILSGVLYLWVLLLFAHYNSVLKSFLINKHQEILFTSLDDIVQRKDYRVLIKKGALLHNYFMISDEFVHKDIFQRVQYHPDNLITNYQQVINFLCNEKAVFIEFNKEVEKSLGGGAIAPLPCKLVKKSQVHFTASTFSSFRKDFPYESIFRTKLMKLFEGGVYKRKFQGRIVNTNDAASSNFALTLSHTLTPIIVLCAGIICSMIALCVELFLHHLYQLKHI